jgi:hypothetical protein
MSLNIIQNSLHIGDGMRVPQEGIEVAPLNWQQGNQYFSFGT